MIRKALLGFASLLTLAACGAAGPDYVRPQTAASAAAPFIGGRSPVVTAEAPNDNWWQLYQDPVLDRLVADALAANKDLAVAQANLAKARASLRLSRSDRLPQTQLTANPSYGRLPESQRAPGADKQAWSIDAGLSVSYEVDLFGRVRRSVEAARGDADAAAAALDVARVGVAAETARAYADASASA
jgi:outer membrane protein TolC